jgi:CBS domain-containing protein
MQIKEIMKTGRDLVTCAPSDTVMEAAKKMKESNVGCILVTDKGALKGIVTDRDITLIVVAQGKSGKEVPLKDVMETHLFTGKPDWDLYEVTKLMAEKKIRRLPIQSDGRLEGFVSLADLAPVVRKELDSFLEISASFLTH